MDKDIQKELPITENSNDKLFHVKCSPLTGNIYAGTINKSGTKWLKKNDVTEEALAAVRDHFMNILADSSSTTNTIGYQWTRIDGSEVTLQLTVKPKTEEGERNA